MSYPVLTLLSDIDKSHAKIVGLATQLDWDAVNDEWMISLQKLLELEKFPIDQLPAQERAKAIQDIKKLLEQEEQISGMISPWLEQVRPLLESFDKHPFGLGKSDSDTG